MLLFAGCKGVDDLRIPSMPVNIDLSNSGLWMTYGVSGFGEANYFVLQQGSERLPQGFPYKETSRTGFGGVLLISGNDPFTLEAGVPLAYDLACPVEKQPTVRVYVDVQTMEAVCPVCGSKYNVVTQGGAPMAGTEAARLRYGLRRYKCQATQFGGYLISDRP